MTSATDPGGTTTTYAYDGAGNRTERKVGGQAKEITSYDEAGHPVRTTKGGTEIASYRTDPTGSVFEATRAGATTAFAYDVFGRTASALTPQGEVSYAYDALDRTVSRTLGEETTSFSYSGTSHELAKEQGQQATLYATSPSGPLARKVGDSPAEWLLRDLHTDLSATVSLGGAVTASFTYAPWGEPRTSSGDSTLGFQADPTDPETGLVDMGTRLYDAALGRFTTRDILFGDPLTPLSLNQFIYGAASPIGNHDPTGLCPPQYCIDRRYHGPGHTRADKLQPPPAQASGCSLACNLGIYEPAATVRIPEAPDIRSVGTLVRRRPHLNPYRTWRSTASGSSPALSGVSPRGSALHHLAEGLVGVVSTAHQIALDSGRIKPTPWTRTVSRALPVLQAGLQGAKGCLEADSGGKRGGCVGRGVATGGASLAGCLTTGARMSPLPGGAAIGCALGGMAGPMGGWVLDHAIAPAGDWVSARWRALPDTPNSINSFWYGLSVAASGRDWCNGGKVAL